MRTERHVWGMGMGVGCVEGGVVGLLWRMEGWRVRGVIKINVRVRTLINSKFEMLLVKK